MDLEEFNRAPTTSARELLRGCVAVEEWVAGLSRARPYPDLASVLQHAQALAQDWTPEQVDAALAAPPGPGDPGVSVGVAASMRAAEQAGIGPDVDLAQAVHEANVAYEKRFGRVFLLRADGHSGQQVLIELLQRLEADPGQEAATTAEELRWLALTRLRQALSGEGSPDSAARGDDDRNGRDPHDLRGSRAQEDAGDGTAGG